MHAEQEQRRLHLLRLMNRYRVTCGELAALMDRKPHTVRCWRSGVHPVPDHTLALIELALMLRAGALRRKKAA